MHRLAIGKRHEFMVWARLLKEGLDIYPSLVDDKGIDAIVGHESRYFEVQVKSAANWTGQRGFKLQTLQKFPHRVFIVSNHSTGEIRFFTSCDILNEPAWADKITWEKWSQIPLSKTLLEKYGNHDWNGLINYLKTHQ